jgi:hypothetical protein
MENKIEYIMTFFKNGYMTTLGDWNEKDKCFYNNRCKKLCTWR